MYVSYFLFPRLREHYGRAGRKTERPDTVDDYEEATPSVNSRDVACPSDLTAALTSCR